MFDLFALVPSELFHPLASPGAIIYANILLQFLAETQHYHEPVSRERAVDLIAASLADRPDGLVLTVDADGEAAGAMAPDLAQDAIPNADATLTRSRAILRYLERCGWLKSETQSDFTQLFVLPDYASRLLRVMADIASQAPPPLAGLIYTIHSVLQSALRDGNTNFGIAEACRHTEHLVNSLKELHDNIGLHINRVLARIEPHAVLEQFFREYQAEIVDRAYHQLRTTDHVSRYRPGVLQALDRLGERKRIEEAARRKFERREAASVESAAALLEEQIARMREVFEQLDRQLQAVDARHNQFVHAAVRAVEVHLAAHTTTSGQLTAILKALLNGPPRVSARVLPQVHKTMQFFRLELLDESSLAPAARAGQPFEPDEQAEVALSAEDVEAAQRQVMAQLSHAVSPERVRRFAAELLRDRAELRASEIPLGGPADLPLLMYLRAYGNDGRLGYHVEETGHWVRTQDYAFRDFRIRAGRADSPPHITTPAESDGRANSPSYISMQDERREDELQAERLMAGEL